MSPRKPPGRLDDVRFVTAHYDMLQGLALVPGLLAMAFLFATLSSSGGRFASWGWTVVGLVGLGVATLLSAVIGRWYRRTYGDLVPRRSPGRRAFLVYAGTLVVLFIARLTMEATDVEPTVSPEMVIVSLVALGAALALRPLRPALLTVGLIGLVLGALPLGTWMKAGTHPLSEIEMLIVAVCLGQAVVAMWSHVVLTRMLGRSRTAA